MSDVEKLVEALEWAKTAVLAIITLETTLGTGRNHAKLVEGYDLINNALEANRKAEAMGGWRPIEEAPRDGTSILTCAAPHEPCTSRFITTPMGRSGWATIYINEPDDEDALEEYMSANLYEPTHFMPLPAAPEGVG